MTSILSRIILPVLFLSSVTAFQIPHGIHPRGNTRLYNNEKNDELIRSAIPSDVSVDIQWKPGSIIVTVNSELPLDTEEEEEEEEEESDVPPPLSITSLARAINEKLEETEAGQQIAETHSIEVTTRGASNVLEGDIMFNAYAGFDVLVTYWDAKKQNEVKQMEARLVERNDTHLVLNIKGRSKKIPREDVRVCELPKAKKEKL